MGNLAALVVLALLAAMPAQAQTFTVSDDAELRSALSVITSGGTILFSSNITLTADLPAVQADITIDGGGYTLTGNNQFRGLFIGAFSGSTQVPVTVVIQNLAIINAAATAAATASTAVAAGPDWAARSSSPTRPM